MTDPTARALPDPLDSSSSSVAANSADSGTTAVAYVIADAGPPPPPPTGSFVRIVETRGLPRDPPPPPPPRRCYEKKFTAAPDLEVTIDVELVISRAPVTWTAS